MYGYHIKSEIERISRLIYVPVSRSDISKAVFVIYFSIMLIVSSKVALKEMCKTRVLITELLSLFLWKCAIIVEVCGRLCSQILASFVLYLVWMYVYVRVRRTSDVTAPGKCRYGDTGRGGRGCGAGKDGTREQRGERGEVGRGGVGCPRTCLLLSAASSVMTLRSSTWSHLARTWPLDATARPNCCTFCSLRPCAARASRLNLVLSWFAS